MSKINQIQRKILELEGGAFQKLIDSYLTRKGYGPINPIGSVVGSNKTRVGTPDTLIPTNSGCYIFVEYTTKHEDVTSKFLNDLQNCFDEEKVGIPIDKIERIILCSTSDLNTADLEVLRNEAQSHGVILDVIGLGDLSFALLEHYSGIAYDHLGIEVDTRQILTANDFVLAYNRNKLTAPLDTDFLFRKQEQDQIISALSQSDLVILAGPPGVGKSRLALECCRHFVETHSDYKVRCILNRGQDIYQDLQVHFSEPGNFLILVDDANRISGFDYIVQKMMDQRDDQSIKIIATVRDYARDKVHEIVCKMGEATEISLEPFTDVEIAEFVESEYGIRNRRYQDRITELAKGNPRLAVMIARVAVEKNSLSSISDVASLYETYFSSVTKDLAGLNEQNLIIVAGIVAFLRVVDSTNEEQSRLVEAAFGIDPTSFWTSINRLHELEVLDLYENEVAKPSDQILATYLFYDAFFIRKLLSFDDLFTHFFPNLGDRIVDAINSVVDAFDAQLVQSVVEPAIRKAFEQFQGQGNDENLRLLLRQYSRLIETETLLYVRNWIGYTEAELVELHEISFEANSGYESASPLTILGTFHSASESASRSAVNLILDYSSKWPGEIPQVIHLLTTDFGIRRDSYSQHFTIQQLVLDELWKRITEDENTVNARLFVAVSRAFLHIHFDETQSKNNTLILYNFDVPITESLLHLREQIWKRIFELKTSNLIGTEFYELVRDYCQFVRHGNSAEAVKTDRALLLPFLCSIADERSLLHCVIVHDYLDLLDDYGIEFDSVIRSRFETESFQILELLSYDRNEHRSLGLAHSEYQQLREQKLHRYFANYDLEAFKALLVSCIDVLELSHSEYHANQIKASVLTILRNLAKRNGSLFVKVLNEYLMMQDFLKLQQIPVAELIEVLGADKAYDLISRHEYKNRNGWLIKYHFALRAEEISASRLENLLYLFRESSQEFLYQDFDNFLTYQTVDDRAVPKIVEILLDRISAGHATARVFESLFNRYSEVNTRITELFIGEDIRSLQTSYLLTIKTNSSTDYDTTTLNQILDVDPDFIDRYLKEVCFAAELTYYRTDDRNYDMLWLRDDFMEVLTRIVVYLLDRVENHYRVNCSFLRSIILKTSDKEEILQRQNEFFSVQIQQYSDNMALMRSLFRVMTHFETDRRRDFTALFLECNRDYTDFEEVMSQIFSSGSYTDGIQYHEEIADYFQSILPLLDSVDLLEHKYYIEGIIRRNRTEADKFRRRAFMND